MLVFILAKIEVGKDMEVLTKIKKLMKIRKASLTYGIYDLHMELEVETTDELDTFVFDELRKISGITETMTMISSKVIK